MFKFSKFFDILFLDPKMAEETDFHEKYFWGTNSKNSKMTIWLSIPWENSQNSCKISKICKESYPDITQFDKKSKYYDPKATEEVPRWFLVDMEPVAKFDEMVTLDQLKDNSSLEGMLVIKRGQRLSIQPVEKEHFDEVCQMANIHL